MELSQKVTVELSESEQCRETRGTPSRADAERIVAGAGWLPATPPEFRAEVLRHARLQHAAPGDVIFRFGDAPGGIYGLVAGTLRINTAPPDAVPRLIHLGRPGAWTGEGCFLTGQPRRAEVQALGEAWLMHLPLPAMEQIAAGDARAVRAFGSIAVLTVEVLIRIVHDLQKRDASRRIASVLHRAAWIGASPIPLTQSEIGIMANASRQQVSAAMKRFAEAGWIETTYRSITVARPQALRDYAGDDGDD